MKKNKFLESYSRTGHFSYGYPRSLSVCESGKKVLFLRSKNGNSPVLDLYEIDTETGEEELLVDIEDTLKKTTAVTSEFEARMRERLRETSQGITNFSVDTTGKHILCSSGSAAIYHNKLAGSTTILEIDHKAHSFRISPSGKLAAYVKEGALWCYDIPASRSIRITPLEDKNISWGVAEFVAAEEMNRYRGFWWSPDSTEILVARVDVSGVSDLFISNPNSPSDDAVRIKYPYAGTENAVVSLSVFDVTGVHKHDLLWDNKRYEYLYSVEWASKHITLRVVGRSQKKAKLIVFDSNTKEEAIEFTRLEINKKWLRECNGSPTWWGADLVSSESNDTSSTLYKGQHAIKIDQLIIRDLVGCDERNLYFTANPLNWPEQRHIYSINLKNKVAKLTFGESYNLGSFKDGILAIISYTLQDDKKNTTIINTLKCKTVHVEGNPETFHLESSVNLHKLGVQKLSAAIILPKNYDELEAVPVIMCPYGGPEVQRVIAGRAAYSLDQWFAEQGYAVIVCDGRGTPGRGAEWEYSIQNDLATIVLEDQVTALKEAQKVYPKLDLNHVGIRGWSFGGYLSALALLEKPGVFHAAVAGAPVTDWSLYDTFYTERYLGLPDQNDGAYGVSSLVKKASKLTKPLLLVHGFADDNVVPANTLKFAEALFHSGKTHLFSAIMLGDQSHMTTKESTTATLLKAELKFFDDHLKPNNVLK